MNMTDEFKSNECLKYHKDLHNHISSESIRCNSCTSTFHKQRDQRQLTFYRKNPYCLSCLKNKDILKYNPYYEVLETSDNESEKLYLQNQYSNEDLQTISPFSDILENCEIHSIESLPIKADKRMLSFKFINIDGNASNFNTLSTTLAAMAHDFTAIGVAETNIESELKDLYSIPGYESINQDKMCRKKKGSGVAMYVHKDINFVHNKEMSVLTSDIEALFIDIYNETGSTTVGTVYRPPNGNYTKFIESLTKIMSIDPRLFEEYRRYRNKLSYLIKTAKQQHYSHKLLNSTGNLKQTWAAINELRGKSKANASSFFTINDTVLTDKKSIANKFNNYFRNLAATLNEDIPKHHIGSENFKKFLPKSEQSSLFLNDTEVNEVIDIIKEFSNDKSSDFPIVVVKHCAPIIIAPKLSRLYNSCMLSGSFPDDLKFGIITPVYKKGQKDKIENYRPISTLPIFGKIFEKLLYSRIYDFMIERKIIVRHSLVSVSTTPPATL